MQRESQYGCKNRRNFSSFFCCVVAVSLSLFMLFSPVYGEEEKQKGKEIVVNGPSVLLDKWGIEIVRLKVTAAGHIIDLRYRVIDPVKSFPVFDTKIKPVLIDEQSGRDLSVYTAPKIGGMRQKTRRPEAGRIYFILFSNPGGLIKEGSQVTLKIEDVKVEHIRVEGDSSQIQPKNKTDT
jgi:hypothetical protein